mmetsp:Transcript_23309/g.20686  ORF Transcript_23309/g.20686 Transcript_23309/m.20686 type:complete len:195 (-) Transcript_23309:33-617(-)
MLFITGIILYSSGNTTEVNGITGYTMFMISIFLVIFERVLHIIVIWLLAKFSKRKANTVKYNETEDDEYEVDRFGQTSLMRSQDMNATGAGFRKTVEHPFSEQCDEKPQTTPHLKDNKKSLGSVILLIGVSLVFIFTWVFILMMSLNYSTRAGFLWAICFGWHVIITFGITEPSYVFVMAILVFRKGWKINELM